MNTKINPWMIATIFLSGLIIGFGVGRFPMGGVPGAITNPTLPNQAGTENRVQIKETTPQTNQNQTTPPPQPIQTVGLNDYSSIEKSKDASGHFSIGNKNAKVKIVEYTDFQCSFCYRYFESAFPQIVKDYIAQGKVLYTQYNFPLNIHPQAPLAAQAAHCAGDQNKFWEFHDLIFQNQGLWSGNSDSEQVFMTLAQNTGIDTAKFQNCLNAKNNITSLIEKDLTDGEKKKVSGTPTLFINTQKIVGAQDYEVFKKAIEDELKK